MSAVTTASRARMVRKRARLAGLRMVQRGGVVSLYGAGGGGTAVLVGELGAAEAYLSEIAPDRRPGPQPAPVPAAWATEIAGYLRHLAAAGQSAATLRSRRLALARMGRALRCPPADVTAEAWVAWSSRQQWAPETRRDYRSAARGFFRWLYRTGRSPVDIGADLPPVRLPPAAPRPVDDAAWAAALAAADDRLRLMLRLAAEAGLRRSEAAKVRVRDVVDGPGGPVLVVLGKGGKTRHVPITAGLAEVVRRGAAGHTPAAAAFGGSGGWLFPDNDGGHLTPAHVGKMVAAVLPAGHSMHKLRHRYATRAFRGSRNLRAVQVLLGHSSVATTERYTAVDDDEVRAAAMFAADPDHRA